MPALGIDNFLDSQKEETTAELSGSSKKRPWRMFWPPQRGDALYKYLLSDCPEALFWRFDPEKPFNRPWQQWTKVARVKAASREPPKPPAQGPGFEEERNANVSTRALMVDEEIKTLQLPSVTPEIFNYLAPLRLYDIEKPYHSRLPFLNELRRTNIVGRAYSNVKMYQVDGFEDYFTIKRSGFQFTSIPFDTRAWSDEVVRQKYLPAMAAWLKKCFECREVHVYAYNFRSTDGDRTSTEHWIAPFMRAHCDVSLRSSTSRLKLHLPNEASEVAQGRVRFINMWRPLTGPGQDCPLAVCDFRTVENDDLVAADIVFPHYCDEGYELKYNASHRWFYKKAMLPHEVIVFKLYDHSAAEATLCPHSAFVDPTADSTMPRRASVELRAILLG